MKLVQYEITKDGFEIGEYSIYLREYNENGYISETYCFGVSKKYQAVEAINYLNKILNQKGKNYV